MISTTVKPPADTLKKSSSKPSDGVGFSLAEYFKGLKGEWTKISWPPREQVIAETGVVLVVVAIFSLAILAIDKVFQFLIQLLT